MVGKWASPRVGRHVAKDKLVSFVLSTDSSMNAWLQFRLIEVLISP
jgi:hypothetical protein